MNDDPAELLQFLPSGSKPILRIFHASDLHFGPPFIPEVAEAALRAAHQQNPDVVVISGDLTQRARRDQFADARKYLDRFPEVPLLVIPGNHDVPLYRFHERITNPHGLYKELIQEDLNPVIEVPGVTLVGLDSTNPRTSISNGRIDSWQLDFCRRAFERAARGTLRIIVAHHHFAPAHDNLRDSAMRQSKRAIECFVNLNVDLILGGHLHRAYIGNTLDFYPGPRRDRGIIIAQSGTTTSRRGRGREQEKNTFNVVEIHEHRIDIIHYLYFDSQHGFIPTSRHSFRRDPVGAAKPLAPVSADASQNARG